MFRVTIPAKLSFSSKSLYKSGHLSTTPRLIPSLLHRPMSHLAESAARPEPDQVVKDIADYVHDYQVTSDVAWETARLCLIDTIGCGLEGLRFKECSRLLGPVVEGTVVPNGNFSHINQTD